MHALLLSAAGRLGAAYSWVWSVCSLQISDNYIPGDTERKMEGEKKNTMLDNEIIPDKASPVEANLSNKISMASTANSSIFERTEVLTGNNSHCS